MSETPRTPDDEGTAQMPVQPARDAHGSPAPATPAPATPAPAAPAPAGLPPRRQPAVWVVVAAVVGGVMLLGLVFTAGFGAGYLVGDRSDGGWSRFGDRMGPGMMDDRDDRGRNGERLFPRDGDSRGRDLPDSQDGTSGS